MMIKRWCNMQTNEHDQCIRSFANTIDWTSIMETRSIIAKKYRRKLRRKPCINSLKMYTMTSYNWKHFPRYWPFVRGIHRHESGLTLTQVMPCGLTAPSHNLSQCWLIIRKVYRHSSEGNPSHCIISSWAKCFQMHFREWNILYFDFIEVCS